MAYSATCYVRMMFDVVRLVTAAQSSSVACARLVNAIEFPWNSAWFLYCTSLGGRSVGVFSGWPVI